ncbi:hypothetical protein DL95DRAFT_406082 [Leptodontidium sp. 2 PMI_412]|nr:hypothetical protein DL95DRAFT_406082 [Leptodontidium sp. 2 PMI_412]
MNPSYHPITPNKPNIGSLITESPVDNQTHPPLYPNKRSNVISRLGKFSTTLLLSSFLMCFGCLAFLTFLWATDTDNAVWRKIVLAGWVTRSVTITSLVLRWATAAQATICASMLAAVLLQRCAVPLHAAAGLSIMRVENAGPWTLLSKMRTNWHIGSFPIAILAILLSVTTLALQFTSTALLSQVGLATLPVFSTAQTYYGTDPDGPTFSSQIGAVRSYLDITPKGYPAFAEWVSNTTLGDSRAQHGEYPPSSTPGIRDSGTVVRAFLPIADINNRTRVTEYSGFGTAVDTRVVCTRPNLTNVEFTSGSGYLLTGLVDIEQAPAGLLQTPDDNGSSNYSMSFQCGFGAAASNNYSLTNGWPLALCVPSADNSKQGIYSVMDPPGLEELGKSYLLINATSTSSVTTLDSSDVWTNLVLQATDDSTNSVTLQFTLCMTAFSAQELLINATRPDTALSEPALTWNTTTATWNTSSVQQQLGSNPDLSITDRGLFALQPRVWGWVNRPEFPDLTGGAFSTTSALDSIGSSDRMYQNFLNDAQYSVFSHMGGITADPAVTLQAFLTTVLAITYYDRVGMFDVSSDSSMIVLEQVTRPLKWTAYAVVVAVVGIHLCLVVITGLVFWGMGGLSQVGGAWAAVAQMLGPATEGWVGEVGRGNDGVIKKMLRTRGMQTVLVRVEDVQGRVQLVTKTKIG